MRASWPRPASGPPTPTARPVYSSPPTPGRPLTRLAGCIPPFRPLDAGPQAASRRAPAPGPLGPPCAPRCTYASRILICTYVLLLYFLAFTFFLAFLSFFTPAFPECLLRPSAEPQKRWLPLWVWGPGPPPPLSRARKSGLSLFLGVGPLPAPLEPPEAGSPDLRPIAHAPSPCRVASSGVWPLAAPLRGRPLPGPARLPSPVSSRLFSGI